MTLNPILQAAFMLPAADETPVTPRIARGLPAVAKALGVIAGMAKQMPMQAYRGETLLPRPRILAQPDPTRGAGNFIECCVQDYLLNGNVVTYTTTTGANSYPGSVAWLPAARVGLNVDPHDGTLTWWFDGVELDPARVQHVRRGADDSIPQRGVGVVEQHLAQLGKVRDQETYERRILQGGAVPSVAVITPNKDLRQVEADAAKESWIAKYGGPTREPAILPAGTEVIPLAWSPADSEMTEARKLSLLDVANIFGMDGYWVGAPTSSLTYRSPGPMYLTLLRQTVSPLVLELEQVWGQHWLPYGTELRFDRTPVLQDDMSTTVAWVKQATDAGLMSINEGRTRLGLPRLDDPAADVPSPRLAPAQQTRPEPADPSEEGLPA